MMTEMLIMITVLPQLMTVMDVIRTMMRDVERSPVMRDVNVPRMTLPPPTQLPEGELVGRSTMRTTMRVVI